MNYFRGASCLLLFVYGVASSGAGQPVESVANGLPVTVQVHPASGTEVPPTIQLVYYRRGESSNPSRIDLEKTEPGNQVVVERSGLWFFTIEAPGLWCSGEWVEIPQRKNVSLAVFRAGEITGTSGSSPRDDSLRRVLARFRKPLGGNTSSDAPSLGFSPCSYEEPGRYSCTAPAGEFDVDFFAQGYVPVYFWNVRIPAKRRVDLGKLRFLKGASLSGRVSWGAVSKSKAETTVILEPILPASSKKAFLFASPDKNGFFQFSGLQPAKYRIRAKQEGLISSIVDVEVLPDAEAQLNRPLVLSSPAQLVVSLVPPVDAFQQPWAIQLAEVDRTDEQSVKVVKVSAIQDATYEGRSVFENLGIGRTYGVSVRDSRGAPWQDEYLEIKQEITSLQLNLAVEHIRGQISRGKSPLMAELRFGGGSPESQIKMKTDEEGRFEGHLPKLGEWEVEVVANAPGLIARNLVDVRKLPGAPTALISICLPDGRLKGRVLDKGGKLVAHALVDYRPAAAPFTQLDVEGGVFELSSLPVGDLEIRATAGRASSEQKRVTITRDREDPAEVELVLREGKDLRGRVLSHQAQPVTGAKIYAIEHTQPFPVFLAPFYTDEFGRFVTHVSDVPSVDLAISASGFAKRVARVPVKPDEPLTLVLSPSAGNILLSWKPQPNEGLSLEHDGAVFLPAYWFQQPPGDGKSGKSFEMFGLEPGIYTVCSIPPGSANPLLERSRCATGIVPAGSTARITLPPP